MQTDRGFVVHRAGGEWDSTLKVSDALHVTTSRDILAAMARGQGPDEAVVALGYAGWDSGQLEEEIRANAWLSAPVDCGLIFELPFESRWHAAGRLLGVDLSRGQSHQRKCLRPRSRRARKIVVAFDHGLRRIGVACGDTVSRNAAGLKTLPAGPEGPRWELIASMMHDWQPALAVVGLPYNVDGSENEQSVAARGFAAELAAPLRRGRSPGGRALLVARSRSPAAERARVRVARRRVAKSDVDAAAACVILERWFSENDLRRKCDHNKTAPGACAISSRSRDWPATP